MAAETLTLYLDLEKGTHADLEVVASASLAFAAAVRELAYVLDPSIELKIELVSETEGSLSINSILKAIKEAGDQPVTLKALIITALVWFGTDVGGDMVKHEMAKILDGPATVTLSDPDKEKLAEMIAKAVEKGVAKEHVQRVYQELERDPHVTGVGATPQRGKRPPVIVPRSEFGVRSGHTVPAEVTVQRREKVSEEELVLIKPVLKKGDRRWRFQAGDGEFSAPIRDEAFLERMVHGQLPIQLAGGIRMSVELKTTEELKDKVWTIVDREIVRVKNILPPPPDQEPLPGIKTGGG